MPATGPVPETILGVNCSMCLAHELDSQAGRPGDLELSTVSSPSTSGDHTEHWHMITS